LFLVSATSTDRNSEAQEIAFEIEEQKHPGLVETQTRCVPLVQKRVTASEPRQITDATDDDFEENLLLSISDEAFLEVELDNDQMSKSKQTDVVNFKSETDEKLNVDSANGSDEPDSELIQVEYGDQSERYNFSRNTTENYIKDMEPELFRKILTCAAAAGRSEKEGAFNSKVVTGGLVQAANNHLPSEPTENAE
uniref:ERCC6 protein n=1 Tax=Echinostoma caproni TaxID=27848 RepID=A0A183AQW2_9TREM